MDNNYCELINSKKFDLRPLRAKWIFGDLWCYGAYVVLNSCVMFEGYAGPNGDHFSAHHIDTDTIGKSSGRQDYKGNTIFEDDIIQSKNKCGEIERWLVFWNEAKCCFSARRFGIEDEAYLWEILTPEYVVRIIGNIHDNPELTIDVAKAGGKNE